MPSILGDQELCSAGLAGDSHLAAASILFSPYVLQQTLPHTTDRAGVCFGHHCPSHTPAYTPIQAALVYVEAIIIAQYAYSVPARLGCLLDPELRRALEARRAATSAPSCRLPAGPRLQLCAALLQGALC